MPARRATSAATPTRSRRAAKTRHSGAQPQDGPVAAVSWMSSYLADCSERDKQMRDMITMIRDAGLSADIHLRTTWYVKVFDLDSVTGDGYGVDLTDTLSRAWNRYREARAAFDKKAEAAR